MLAVSGLEAAYGTSQVLNRVDLRVEAGEVATLMGRNGMGKTTTVHSIMGIVRPRAGEIRFRGNAIGHLPSYRIAQAGLGLVPEGRQIFPTLNVTENLLATASNRRGRAAPWTVARVFEMFPELEARRSSLGRLLSGGEQQMLAIGRALLTNPDLLILDEATEGLAPLIRREIWACLERLKAEGQSILVIDKNVADLARIADRHYILEKGLIVWEGTSEALGADRSSLERYLGV
jgi:branched-chain amino acid transport system ATP-binding protein